MARPLERMAQWVRSDEMHQAFNFEYLDTPWMADPLRKTYTSAFPAYGLITLVLDR